MEKTTSNMFQTAVVLHSRAYRENASICQLLTEQYGRVTAMVRHKRNGDNIALFNIYNITLNSGRDGLYFIDKYELNSQLANLDKHALFSGLYVNELLVKLLKQTTQPAEIIHWYCTIVRTLSQIGEQLEPLLRNFELDLIDELGVMPDFGENIQDQTPIQSGLNYQFLPDQGWSNVIKSNRSNPVLSGDTIIKIGQRVFNDTDTLKQAKYLTRWWLDYLLVGKPIKSRALFKTIR